MKTSKLTRRSAVKAIAASACAFNIVPRHVLGGPGYTAPSETLTRGVIGVGGMGNSHLGYGGSKIIAVCDVNKSRVDNAVKRMGKDCTGYSDFRELIARPDIDIVSIVTPPHWHGLMAIAAAEAGKDVWCEKPVTRTVGEGKALVEACRRNSTILRVNTWFRLEGNFYGLGTPVKQVKKIVDSGMLGWPLKLTVSKHTGFDWKISMGNGRFNNTAEPVPQG
ncbi:MAG: Gfo/Idh/MocA family oxidoreductase, partial [Lentisphaeraceae bacterium]|nr:Gfo/Idh/MocA family oxidoreductase [Lentisphaeraceae bacterium]